MDWKTLLNSNRRRQSTIVPDHRAQFERDYDRTIFSTPVKRLQDKAQVFPLEPNDAVRTRLTHSLEVATVARGLATKVSDWLCDEGEIERPQQRWIEAIASTCGLIHDLGNPPFGHAGEDAIREWFTDKSGNFRFNLATDQERKDFEYFEGNAQTLRIVSKLQILADLYGLNLTFGTLSAACKYTASSVSMDPNNQAKKKLGYFASENSLIDQIRSETGIGDSRNPITFLVEAADDIVYSVADIEDALKKGVIKWRDLVDRFDKILNDQSHTAKLGLEQVLKVKDRILGGASSALVIPDDAHGSAFRTASISFMVPKIVDEFITNYSAIMSGQHPTELVAHRDICGLMTELKNIGRELVYPNRSTVKLELMGRRIISDLMDLFWEGASVLPSDKDPKTKDFPGRIGTLLSRNYRTVFQHAIQAKAASDLYCRLQLVTDYVCGMTDSFAVNLHRELHHG